MRFRILLIAVISLTLAGSTFAHHFRYTANLVGGTQIPANASPGLGHVVITVDEDLAVMEVEATFSGLIGTVTAAHIHAPTLSEGTGFADEATQVPTFVDFPLGVTSGSYEHEFNLAEASTYNPAFITATGGTVGTAFNAFLHALDDGKAYFNIRTSAFNGGEIRGFLSYVLGDFNDNGIVDAADYVVWRKMLNTTGEGLKADSNNDNEIDNNDYTAWRQSFGNVGLSSGSGSGALIAAQIPEPTAILLVVAAMVALLRTRVRC